MSDPLRHVLSAAIIRLLRPLVRIALRNGVSYHAFTDLLRWVYTDIAGKHFGIPGRKVSKSRIAVLTGLTRREVDRLVRIKEPRTGIPERYNRAARTLSGWAEDRDFFADDGTPAILPFEGERSFSEVVRRYSGNQPARAVLDELVRVGAVERLGDGYTIKLVKTYYEPVRGDQEAEQIAIMGLSAGDLLSTIDHNIRAEPEQRLYQQEVYERLSEEQVASLLPLLRERLLGFSERLDRELFELRQQVPADRCTRRVGIGIYVFEHPWDESVHGAD